MAFRYAVLIAALLLACAAAASAELSSTDLSASLMRLVDASRVDGATCEQVGCVLKNKNCSGNVFHFGPGPRCTSNCCAIGLNCHDGVCKANNFGQTCASGADCFGFGPNSALCLDGKCEPVMNPGDTCKDSAQCVGNAVCSQGVCQGVPLGSACTTNDECVFDAYCAAADNNTAVCAPLRQTGQSCQLTSDCAYRNHCVNTVCVAEFNQAIGQACNPTYHFWQQQCADGLVCDPRFNSCSSPTTSFAKQCVTNATCGIYACQCNPYVGKSQCDTNFMPKLQCQSDAAHSCAVKNRCRGGLYHYFQGTCLYEKCSSEVMTSTECACPLLKRVVGKCLYLPLAGYSSCEAFPVSSGMTGGQIAGLIIGLLIAFALFAGLGYWYYHRRNAAGYVEVH